MNSHTPGAWEAKPCGCGDPKCRRYRIVGPNIIGPLWEKEDVYLAAAAPELLEACKWANDFWQQNMSVMPVAFQSVANSLEAAIAKAEGRWRRIKEEGSQ